MSAGSDGAHGSEPVGSLHEEAVRLLGALGEVAGGMGAGAGAGADHGERRHEPLAGDCRFCPVCQMIHAVRETVHQTSPEVREHLATAATALLQAATELLSTRPESGGTSGSSGSGEAPAATGSHGTSVERIDLDEDPSTPPA
ncbi:hypothetical protein D9V37_11385 [Nocardioides mangrovicus]|uniref:Uncharacterized protein n=1 Tax=Nocardioides mangrovicus TaxID=2478913 RepID=A0A3L8P2E9_9ACTN|nr:hypothetical protein [Nocardioides mangrovicus]RLV49157.1 hypothetical protein D9V37_11385 [Nocardioides mangrovicus]